jgi:hypothetical protein
MDAGERQLFAKVVQDAVARGGDLDAALAELGWAEALADDEPTAVAALFEAQGRAGATSGALALVLGRALDAPLDAVVVLPTFGRTAPPGSVADDTVTVTGLALGGEGPLVVPCGAVLATVAAGALRPRPIHGLDPGLGLVELRGSAEAATRPLAPGAWEAALAAGQRAVAHQLVGAAAQILALAREHALDRVQFGVPIASFQALRHKLADTYVAVESARAALDAAWEDRSPFPASVAKAIAGRAGRLAATHGQQVLAGIGFTTEHPLHTYVRRVRALDGLLGDSRTLTQAIGGQLLEAKGLPALLPL